MSKVFDTMMITIVFGNFVFDFFGSRQVDYPN
jgi:hypothetical protein